MARKEQDELLEEIFQFLRARHEAEEKDDAVFTCPLCGGNAYWGRCMESNHLRAGCTSCGIKIIE